MAAAKGSWVGFLNLTNYRHVPSSARDVTQIQLGTWYYQKKTFDLSRTGGSRTFALLLSSDTSWESPRLATCLLKMLKLNLASVPEVIGSRDVRTVNLSYNTQYFEVDHVVQKRTEAIFSQIFLGGTGGISVSSSVGIPVTKSLSSHLRNFDFLMTL